MLLHEYNENAVSECSIRNAYVSTCAYALHVSTVNMLNLAYTLSILTYGEYIEYTYSTAAAAVTGTR